ncbi:NOP16 isoform 9 [Pan troglodytes]|uniref:NOP16 nucleolar protein n=2 Tax=Pan troglodytes TaxID=9598 RepID=A0A2I3SA65_PANTR|nr:NOP16 isoform 9 [Pan troglodytes]
MPKAKGKTRRQKFGYSVNRKRLNRNARRKAAPRIECRVARLPRFFAEEEDGGGVTGLHHSCPRLRPPPEQ